MRTKLWVIMSCWLMLLPSLAVAQTNFPLGITTGNSPPTGTIGTGAIFGGKEGTPPTTACAVGQDMLWADSSHQWKECLNGGPAISLSGPPSVCGYPGTAGSAQVNACFAAGNPTCDARCYAGTTVIVSSTITLANSPPPLTLLVDHATNWSCTITNGTPCFSILGAGSIETDGTTSAPGTSGITVTNGAHISSEIQINQVGAGANASVRGMALTGNGAATVDNGLLYLNQASNIVHIEGVQTFGGGTPIGFKLVDVTGPTMFLNDYVDCGHPATPCTPVTMTNDNGGVGTNSTSFIGGVYAHPGANGINPTPIFDVQNGGGSVTGVSWQGITAESFNSTDVAWNLVNCVNCTIGPNNNPSNGGTGGKTLVNISNGGSNNDVVIGLQSEGGWTNMIVNSAVSPTVTITAASVPGINYYAWQGFNVPNAWRTDVGNAKFFSMDSSGLKVDGTVVACWNGSAAIACP